MSYGHTISLRGDKPPASKAETVNLVICRGIPGSGKSTWAQAWIAESPDSRTRVNRDDLRRTLFARDMLTHEQEKVVTKVQHTAIRSLLKSGRDVVCDDTNLRAKTVRDLIKIAEQTGAAVRFVDFDTPVALCIERDRHRFNAGGRCVGETVIQSFATRYLKNGALPPVPELQPVDVQAAATYTGTPGKPTAWIVDIDGTMALMSGRGPFEWHRVGEDKVNEPVADVVRALADYHQILFVSGRDGSCYPETITWLGNWMRQAWGVDEGSEAEIDWLLFMREAGDTRKDAIVKSEIFWNSVAPNFDVQGVLDDRDQVVRMWRALGLTCLQVAPGDF